MSFEVDVLRRRPPGERVLVYVDQSTMSELACNPVHAATRDLLVDAVRADRLVCPESWGHTEESIGAARSWEAILDLHDELSMGIKFYDEKVAGQYEVLNAVARFLGQREPYSLADEA